MRPTHFLMAAALTAAMSAPALAQTTTDGGWFASGFVGANFGTSRDTFIDTADVLGLDLNLVNTDAEGVSLDFGGQVGWMGTGNFGLEFLADFAPSKLDVAGVLFVDDPGLSSYMGNVIWAVPIGVEGNYKPFLSGGFGLIRVQADAFTLIGDPFSPVVNASQNMFGGNIGGGVMAFAGNVGVRGDIRYYSASGNDNSIQSLDTIGDNIGNTIGDTIGNRIGAAAFSGLSFWRGNFGLAFRW